MYLTLLAAPVMLAQLSLQHLADRTSRQLLDDIDRLRRLYRADDLPAVADQAFGVDPLAGLQLYNRLDSLAPLLVGNPDYGAFLNRGMRQHRAFDLGREDVEPATDDHVLEAIDDVVVALVIAVADISSMVPAELSDFGGCRRVLEIADHQTVGSQDNFPRSRHS